MTNILTVQHETDPESRGGSDFCNPGKYSARFGVYASGGNIATFADAVEFISDAIESHFAAFGLNVEFVNA